MSSGVVCLTLCLPLLGAAQSALPSDLAHDLEGKTCLIRGKYVESNLAFDAQGNPTVIVTPGPFFLSAIEIDKARLDGATLEIEGRRAMLLSSGTTDRPQSSDIRFILLRSAVVARHDRLVDRELPVHIVIAGDPGHPEGLPALVAKVLAASIDDALAGKTDSERRAELFTLASSSSPTQPSATAGPSTGTNANGAASTTGPTTSGSSATTFPERGGAAPFSKPGPGVTPPRVIHSVDPQFTEDARRRKVNGMCVLGVIVNTTGFPIHIHIVRSLDPGMDENAIAAVSQYRFAPATYQNHPVAVEVNIEINFKVH